MLQIKRLRQQNNLTQAEIGKILNCNQSAVGKYERGELEISISSLIKLSKFFGVSVDYLLGVEENYNKNMTREFSTISLSTKELKLIDDYRKMNNINKCVIENTANFLSENNFMNSNNSKGE